MTTEPGTTGRSGPAAQATERQTPDPAAAQDSRPYMPAAEHKCLAERLLADSRADALDIAAAQVHATLALVRVLQQNQEPAATSAAEQFDMLGAAQRVRRLTAERRAARDPFSDSALEEARWDLVGLGMGALEPDDLAAFEAAIRIDQREKDAALLDQLAGATFDDDTLAAAQTLIRNGGAT